MDQPAHAIAVRSARNQLIDLLGIGDTYPLADLNVVADQLKVTYGSTAKIPIERAQAGVSYQLCDPKRHSLGEKYRADGADATLVIESPAVNEDVTYRIQATKTANATTLPAQAARFLNEVAPVKVGIDTRLVIDILDAALLDPANSSPQPSDPRIISYGDAVRLRVNKSQEGVAYSLVLDGRDLPESAQTGNLGAIDLPFGPLHEDTLFQVRATKTFLSEEDREAETELLDSKLYVKVRANPVLPFAIEPAAIVGTREAAAIKLGATQASVRYRAYLRPIQDAEFVRGDGAFKDLLTVRVPGKPDVRVRAPAFGPSWQTPEGYAPAGDAALPGNGGDLRLPLGFLAEDAVLLVEARKEHRVVADDPNSPIIASSVRLDQAVVALVRPDPERALSLRIEMIGAQSGASVEVSGGEPGVFYHFRAKADGEDIALPVYFHKRDAQDATQNKGVGQLAIGVDMAIAADPDAATAEAAADPARASPHAPVLDIAPLPSDSKLWSRAVKAQTGIEVQMKPTALIAAVPAIHTEPAVIDPGASANILIPASTVGEKYLVARQGAPLKPEFDGDGKDIAVTSDALAGDAVFDITVTRPAAEQWRVERVVHVAVAVRPDARLPLSARLETVPKGGATDILVERSQMGVLYQLLTGDSAVGTPVPGNGATLALASGAIQTDTTFSVSAARADRPEISAMLKAQVSVKVPVDPAPPAEGASTPPADTASGAPSDTAPATPTDTSSEAPTEPASAATGDTPSNASTDGATTAPADASTEGAPDASSDAASETPPEATPDAPSDKTPGTSSGSS